MPVRPKITPELLTDWVRLSDPRISSDGKRVAYVRTPVARSEEHPTSEIWCVNADGTGDRRLTSGKGQDAAPRWSPDGSRLAFSSDRAGAEKPQLYLMPVDGGEAIRLTERKTSISDPSWSPDGRFIAILSKDEPTDREEDDKKEQRDQQVDGENLKRDRLYVVEPPNGRPEQISPDGDFHVWCYCWAPDSTRLAAATTASPLIADHRGPNDLLILKAGPGVAGAPLESNGSAAEDGFETAVTFPSGIFAPRWSPDQRRIAFLATEGRVKTTDQIFVLDLRRGSYKAAIEGFQGSVSDLHWSSADRIVFSTLQNLHGNLCELNLRSGAAKSLLSEEDLGTGAFGDTMSVARTGTMTAVRTDSAHPGQVFLARPGRPLHRLTAANEQLSAASLRKAEVVSWTAKDGTELFGLQYAPTFGAGPHPTVLVIHGGPASAFADRFAGSWHDWAQLLVGNGYAVFMPNPRGSTGRGSAFTDGNLSDLGGKELVDDLSGLDLLVERGIADPNRLGIAGWSHGGYIAAWAVTQTDRFKASIMGAGVSNMISDQGTNDIPGFNLDYFFEDYGAMYGDLRRLWDRSPMKHVTKVKTPTLILHGEKDDRVAPSQGREFHRALKSLGVPTELVIYPREPHGFREREHQIDVQRRILGWLDRWV